MCRRRCQYPPLVFSVLSCFAWVRHRTPLSVTPAHVSIATRHGRARGFLRSRPVRLRLPWFTLPTASSSSRHAATPPAVAGSRLFYAWRDLSASVDPLPRTRSPVPSSGRTHVIVIVRLSSFTYGFIDISMSLPRHATEKIVTFLTVTDVASRKSSRLQSSRVLSAYLGSCLAA